MSRSVWTDRESSTEARIKVSRSAQKSAAERLPTGNMLRQRAGNQGVRRVADAADDSVVHRQPINKRDAKPEKLAPTTAQGPQQQVYVVRDSRLSLGGGTLVRDLADFKRKVMASKITSEWTVVLSIHGSEERLGAQAPPDWQKDAVFYQASDIDKLFNGDKDFVKWRDQYGPTNLSMVSCQVSASFENTLISNLTRVGPDESRQPGRGLGAGCKPIATKVTLDDAPKSRVEFDRLKKDRQSSIRQRLEKLNDEWGYYGARPVPKDQVLHYFYDEEPKAAWVTVEVMVGEGHDVSELKSTGIPFWNRTTGDKATKFRQICDQGVGKLKREHRPSVPDVPE